MSTCNVIKDLKVAITEAKKDNKFSESTENNKKTNQETTETTLPGEVQEKVVVAGIPQGAEVNQGKESLESEVSEEETEEEIEEREKSEEEELEELLEEEESLGGCPKTST